MSQFGKCNVCATPCAFCMHLALELLAVESTSDSFSNESYEQEASCEQVSETSASSSRKCEGGILDSNNDDSSFVDGAGLSLSVEYQRIDMDKMNKTEELCTCSQRESSSSIIIVRSENEEHKQEVVGSEKFIKFEFSEDSATEFVNSFNHDGGIIPIEQSNAEKPCQVSEFVRCDSESSLSGYVKICAICGDDGHKEFLAVCSKCHVGAEHIYCMRTMLDSVPDSIWMCEECVLSEDKDKMMKTKFEKFVACPMYISSNQSCQGGEISTSSNFKVLPEINTEGLDVDKSRGDETSSLLHASRTAGLVTCRSTTKSLALGIESGPDFLSSDHSKAQAQDFKIKASHELSLSNDLSSRTRSIQEKSGQHLPKPHQLQMATGIISCTSNLDVLCLFLEAMLCIVHDKPCF
ncbi:hypothetical protein ACH5RR_038979 [Cinchona calisaya]|uniref:Zinc finger PHD-type domain-containing protein n=1 Tax=Cinchona calisaya TaxID=153742 RepID=A0ABD2XZD7_9GENT